MANPLSNPMGDLKVVDKMHSRMCTRCLRDLAYRREEGAGCNILLEAIFLQGEPEEWSNGVCDKFEPEP